MEQGGASTKPIRPTHHGPRPAHRRTLPLAPIASSPDQLAMTARLSRTGSLILPQNGFGPPRSFIDVRTHGGSNELVALKSFVSGEMEMGHMFHRQEPPLPLQSAAPPEPTTSRHLDMAPNPMGMPAGLTAGNERAMARNYKLSSPATVTIRAPCIPSSLNKQHCINRDGVKRPKGSLQGRLIFH